jgi:UDP-3-O-[3-hydroxymyristoyl] glucosamine N-acyltransferase
VIRGIGDVRSARPEQIGFVRDPRYAEAARVTEAGALLLANELETPAAQIVVGDVDIAFAIVAGHYHPMPQARRHEIHPSAVVHPEAVLEEPVSIGANAVLGRCRIGAGTVVKACVVIGDDVALGRDCVLYPNVTVYDRTTIGDRFFAHGSCVIGSDGFGYVPDGKTWRKVPQFGGVRIGNDVELGAGTVIDRGAVNNTVIGDGCKFDNLCHIAHNAVIGKNCVMAAGCMVAGSTTVGDDNVWGGKCAAGGHLFIAAGVRLGGGTQALKSIREPGEYMGYPPVEKRMFVRIAKAVQDLPKMRAEWADRREEDPERG